jgi:hypothetical protein
MEKLSFNEICEMSIRQINAFFRKNDESRLYPVLGRFNATERAIRRIRRYRRMGMEVNSGYEYYLTLEKEISEIVNDPRL